jgi:hypothetical protein
MRMQLESPRRSRLGRRLGAAACLLLASGATAARADPAAKWQLDASGLLYGELARTDVLEPSARITRLFGGGQTLFATFAIDVVTGASPTGGIPTTTIQTTTTPSGHVKTQAIGTVPTSQFSDTRYALDLGWMKPFGGWLITEVGANYSNERDYRSVGGSGKISLSLMRGLTTVSVGGGYNDDAVTPHGGTRAPLSDGTVIVSTDSNSKQVSSGLIGLSHVLTRRWMVGLTASRIHEHGYLTEPYKVVSLVDSTSVDPVGQVTEGRPGARDRKNVLLSSVYHFDNDVFYASDRYYWDDWGIHSNAIDLRVRHDLESNRYVEPHVRYYLQTHATFFHYALFQSAPLPDYASADYRLGDLQTFTLGATYGFRPAHSPGEFAIRAEYMRQWGSNSHPGDDGTETEQQTDLSPPAQIAYPSAQIAYPPVQIGSLAVIYTLQF